MPTVFLKAFLSLFLLLFLYLALGGVLYLALPGVDSRESTAFVLVFCVVPLFLGLVVLSFGAALIGIFRWSQAAVREVLPS